MFGLLLQNFTDVVDGVSLHGLNIHSGFLVLIDCKLVGLDLILGRHHSWWLGRYRPGGSEVNREDRSNWVKGLVRLGLRLSSNLTASADTVAIRSDPVVV